MKTAGSGDSRIAVAFTNDGKVVVDTGTIEFAAAVSGAGAFTVSPGAALRFDSSVAGGLSVNFAGHDGGELLLLDSPRFGAAIHGFGGAGTDALDLRDINFSAAGFKFSYSGTKSQGVLTVTDGADTAKLTMFGNYTTASFHASSDGSGGTLIVDPSRHTELLAFAR